MEFITSYLIVASAFSVLAQFFDNRHRDQIKDIQQRLQELDLTNHVLCEHEIIKKIRTKWDNLLAYKRSKLTDLIALLVLYIILVVVSVIVYQSGQYLVDNKFICLHTLVMSARGMSMLLGILLVLLSFFFIHRLVTLSKKRYQYKAEADKLKEELENTEATLKAGAALHTLFAPKIDR